MIFNTIIISTIISTGLSASTPPLVIPTGQSCSVNGPATCIAGSKCDDFTRKCIKVSNIGETCGGLVSDSPVCADGLFCDTRPYFDDLPGFCRPLAKIGESCGGFISFSPVCQEGSKCVHYSNAPADAPGVCVRVALEGEKCGGFKVTNPESCDSGLVCDRTGVIMPDLPGICKRPMV